MRPHAQFRRFLLPVLMVGAAVGHVRETGMREEAGRSERGTAGQSVAAAWRSTCPVFLRVCTAQLCRQRVSQRASVNDRAGVMGLAASIFHSGRWRGKNKGRRSAWQVRVYVRRRTVARSGLRWPARWSTNWTGVGESFPFACSNFMKQTVSSVRERVDGHFIVRHRCLQSDNSPESPPDYVPFLTLGKNGIRCSNAGITGSPFARVPVST